MDMPISTITAKGQTTVPTEVRKMFNLKPNTQIMWISMNPGELSVVAIPKNNTKKGWADKLYGKYADGGIDLTQSFIDDKKTEIMLEERPSLDQKIDTTKRKAKK